MERGDGKKELRIVVSIRMKSVSFGTFGTVDLMGLQGRDAI